MRAVKIVASFAAVFVILAAGVLPAFAVQNMSFNVSIRDDPSSQVQGQYVNVYFKSTEGGSTTTQGPYTDGSTSVITGDFFSTMCLETALTNPYGYTGCTVTVYTDGYLEDITAYVLDLVKDNGVYYVPFGQDVTIKNPWTGTIYFVFNAINFDEYLDDQFGWQAGYDSGYGTGYNDCMNTKYADLLAQYNILLQATGGIDGATLQQMLDRKYQDGLNDGLNAGLGKENFVSGIIEETMNGTGGVLVQLLQMQLFGVPIFWFIAIVALIPVVIFAIKIFAHKG